MRDNLLGLDKVPEVLVPYTDFSVEELATQLNFLVNGNHELLKQRGLLGVFNRYNDLETAENKVLKGQSEQKHLGHFAIVNTAGDVRGTASIIPKLTLKKQYVPMPPAILPNILSCEYPMVGANIHAWTGVNDLDLLSDAYKELVYISSGSWNVSSTPKVWTVEPTTTPRIIHELISASGLQKVATKRFDDSESRRRIPKRSTLYARLQNQSLTSFGRQRELKTGSKSFLTMVSDSIDEIISKNPKEA